MVPVFFEVLAQVERLKSELVVVTGRSVSWAHFLLTHFPKMRACISEGGGVISVRDKHHILDHSQVSKTDEERTAQAALDLVAKLGVTLSTDSFGRRTDRAIELDFLEEPHFLNEVQKFLDDHRINYSVSSVHLNFWAGTMSKSRACETFLANFRGGMAKEETVFFGDSLNDESMFSNFPNTVGVSNIKPILKKLPKSPTLILEGKENEGPYGVLNFLKRI
jgi:hydroxymethylpyrimidine pyrophosphatase-like HAD family hydrolase